VYAEALAHREELCAPYATVIDIDPAKLPSADEVRGWTSEQYTSALRHVEAIRLTTPACGSCCTWDSRWPRRWDRATWTLLEANEAVIAKNVTENLYDRHIAPVFLGRASEKQLLAPSFQLLARRSFRVSCRCTARRKLAGDEPVWRLALQFPNGDRMKDELFSLEGKVAVVTGGTSGIGRALSLGLADAAPM
jgi:hypothetical protein